MGWTILLGALAILNGVLAIDHAVHASAWWAALSAFGAGVCVDGAFRNFMEMRR